ncbi:dynamin family protein [Desulfuromonas thiophila]|uniref:dynamin family protein n=1 Tax=Desulfuromonas thiophila TaxID=57664 RepID=UPI0024A8DA70|nr:dynamin family protein [Desulfuromonas thiophila]
MTVEIAQHIGTCMQKLSDLIEESSGIEGMNPLNLAGERTLLESLHEQQDRPLRVAVIGEFSTGKSTFINSIIGQDLLPARFLPTTRQLMCIRHKEGAGRVSVAIRALVDLPKTNTPENATKTAAFSALHPKFAEASLAEAAPSLTLSPQAILTLAESGQPLEIEMPLPEQWVNVHIYDTPGVNDASNMSESVIFDLMDQVDVVIMMLRAQQALTASESDFISHLVRHKDLDKFFFNINFCDSKSVEEAASVRAHVIKTLGQLRNWPIHSLNDRIFLCSARQTLDTALGKVAPGGSLHSNEHALLLAAIHDYASKSQQALLQEAAENILRTVAESAVNKLSAAWDVVNEEDANQGQALVEIAQAITDFRVAIREEELALQKRITDRKALLIRGVDSAFDDITLNLQNWITTSPLEMLAGDGPGKRLRIAIEEHLTPLLNSFREDLNGAFEDLDQRILPMAARASARIDDVRRGFDLGPLLAGTSLATAGYFVVSATLPWAFGAAGAFAVTAGLASLIPGVGGVLSALMGTVVGVASGSAPQILQGASGIVSGGYGWIRDQIRKWQEKKNRSDYSQQLTALLDGLRHEIKSRLDQAIDPEKLIDGVLNARFPEALMLEERRLLSTRLERDQLRAARQHIETLRADFITVVQQTRVSHE